MNCLKRNKRKFWYCVPTGQKVEILDENGNRTGDYITLYENPVEVMANISPATGVYRTEEFGTIDSYDKVILTDANCPITESCVLFVDKIPKRTRVKTYRFVVIHGVRHIEERIYLVPVYDYNVWRVSKSLNQTAVAVKKAPVGNVDSEIGY